MYDARSQDQAVDVAEYLSVLKRHRFLVLLCLLIGTAAAIAYTGSETRMYTSEAEVLIRPLGSFQGTEGTVNLETESALVTSDAVAARVADELGENDAVAAVLDRVAVSVSGASEVLQISCTDASPERARACAQAFADSYLAFRGEQARDTALDAARTLEEEIVELQVRLGAATRALREAPEGSAVRADLIADRRAFKDQITLLRGQLIQFNSFRVTPGEVVSSATVPTSPSSPHPVRNTLVGGLVGLFLGVALAYVRDRFDTRIRGAEDVRRIVGAPVIGWIPPVKRRRRAPSAIVTVDSPASPAAEAFRALGTTVRSMTRDRRSNVILVTSASASEGKTTVAANLGVVLAATGHRVLLVSADMRAPRLHALFGLPNWSGLTDVLDGSLPLAAAAVPTTVDGLGVLPTGRISSRTIEGTRSDRIEMVLQEARRGYHFVVVDATPVLPVADALALAAHVDSVLFVVDGRTASAGDVADARMALAQVGAPIIGAVLNRVDIGRARYNTYYGSADLYRSDDGDGDDRADTPPTEITSAQATERSGRGRSRIPPAPATHRPDD